MTASGARLLLMAVGVAAAVYAAVRLADAAFADRKDFERRLDSGELAARRDAPAKPPPTPGLARPTGPEEVLVLEESSPAATRPTDRRRVVVLRGDGRLRRLPASPEETGPLVVSIFDRADVDALLRRALAAPASPGPGAFRLTVKTAEGATVRELGAADAEPFRKADGRNVKRSAPPDGVRLRTLAVRSPDGAPPEGAAPPPWPIARRGPAEFLDGAPLDGSPEDLRERWKVLRRGATFRHADGVVYSIADFDVLP